MLAPLKPNFDKLAAAAVAKSLQLCNSVQPHRQQPNQASLSLGFSRQEHWSELPFPSPMHESEVAQLCPTLSDPMDCSLTGSSICEIFQARVLELGAIAFSEETQYLLSIPTNGNH